MAGSRGRAATRPPPRVWSTAIRLPARTLVGNSEEKARPFARQIDNERYRAWLVDLLRGETVILITARPEKYRSATLASIKAKTGWSPQEALFNDLGLPPAEFKRRALLERVMRRHGEDPARYLALESNPKTRAMYARLGVRAIAVGGAPWQSLPE